MSNNCYIAYSKHSKGVFGSKLFKSSVGDVDGEARVPEDAMKQGGDVRQDLFTKVAGVFAWVLVEILLVELSLRVQGNYTVLSVYINHINGLTVYGVLSVSPDLLHFFRVYVSHREVVNDLVASLGGSSPTSHGPDHGG